MRNYQKKYNDIMSRKGLAEAGITPTQVDTLLKLFCYRRFAFYSVQELQSMSVHDASREIQHIIKNTERRPTPYDYEAIYLRFVQNEEYGKFYWRITNSRG